MNERPATRFLRLALRRAARGTGSTRAFYERRTAVQPLPDLTAILGLIRWVLVGGIALRAYIPERMTLDVDVLIHERDTTGARDAFRNAGYRIVGELSIGGFSCQQPQSDAMPVDVLIRSDDWLDAALAAPVYDAAGYPVLARPYLILLKLQAGRTQDLADIQRLLSRTPKTEREVTRRLIQQVEPAIIEDFDSLVTLAELEFGALPDDS
jgi:hypothetical protein